MDVTVAGYPHTNPSVYCLIIFFFNNYNKNDVIFQVTVADKALIKRHPFNNYIGLLITPSLVQIKYMLHTCRCDQLNFSHEYEKIYRLTM